MLAEDRHENADGFAYVTAQLFTGVRLNGATALEIGSGTGLQAIYMAQQGARVVSLEPEGVGSTGGVIAKQRARCAQLGLDVEVVEADFNTWHANQRFDIILARNSINHLYATDQVALGDARTAEEYRRVLLHVRHLLRPGGVFIATDACRYALFTMARRVGIRRPWRPEKTGVNWRHHQNPQTWCTLMRRAGFASIAVDYPVPHRLRHLAPLVNNPAANFFLKGAFILRARAPA